MERFHHRYGKEVERPSEQNKLWILYDDVEIDYNIISSMIDSDTSRDQCK